MFIITHTARRKGAQRHIWMRCRNAADAVKELRRIIDNCNLNKYDYMVYTGDWIKQAELKISKDGAHVKFTSTCSNPVLDLEADYE